MYFTFDVFLIRKDMKVGKNIALATFPGYVKRTDKIQIVYNI